MKVEGLPALRTGRLYPQVNIPGTHFSYRLSQPQGHSATGRIMSMKNSKDTIGNRTGDLPACSAASQRTAPPRALGNSSSSNNLLMSFNLSGLGKIKTRFTPTFYTSGFS